MSTALDRVFREEHGRVVATLVRLFGSIDLAEEMAQEALVAAIETWPGQGVPPNPGAWLTTVARRRAIDRLRRESTRDSRHREAHAMITADDQPDADSAVPDDRLTLMFTCCHPALGIEARVALTLRLIGGLTTAEIASAFLVPETTMAQRLTRAKKKITANRIPYRVPADHELPARVRSVLAALYLVFNEGYLSSGADEPIRVELTAEAIRLARILATLMPDEPEVQGLLALMLLIDARHETRLHDATLVPLDQQDRRRWNQDLITEGHTIVRACLRRDQPGPYQLMAAVNAVHTSATTADSTDWAQVLALYDHLLALTPTPIVALNRAVPVAEIHGPAAALAIVDQLDLTNYHPWHVVRADLLQRLGRDDEAAQAFSAAIARSNNTAEQNYLRRRRAEISGRET